MTTSTHTTVVEAVAAARANQAEESGTGIGINSPGTPYVQWVLTDEIEPGPGEPWTLEALEVGIDDTDTARTATIQAAGFVESDIDIEDITIWVPADLASLSWASDEDLQAHLVALARSLGAEDGMSFYVYP